MLTNNKYMYVTMPKFLPVWWNKYICYHHLDAVFLTGKPSKDGSSLASERFDRAQWKTMQITMNDTTKFVDIMHNVAWEDGLPEDVRAGRGIFICSYHWVYLPQRNIAHA